MGVAANSHPHGPPKCLVEPGSCAKQGTVASHLNIANSAPAPKDPRTPRVSRKGLVLVKLWQTPSFKDVPKDFITLHRVSVGTHPADCPASARLTPKGMLVGRRKLTSAGITGICPQHQSK